MKLTERHIITKKHDLYGYLLCICSKANNLYNRAMFIIRQHYFRLTEKKYTIDISDSSKSLSKLQ